MWIKSIKDVVLQRWRLFLLVSELRVRFVTPETVAPMRGSREDANAAVLMSHRLNVYHHFVSPRLPFLLEFTLRGPPVALRLSQEP